MCARKNRLSASSEESVKTVQMRINIIMNYNYEILTMYYTAILSLYRHVVCNVPVSCKANRDRNQLGHG